MARKAAASVLADYDALADRFRKGIASEEDAGEALAILRDPEFFQTLKTDLLKGGDEDEEEEEEKPDMRRRGRRDDEEENGDEDEEGEGGGEDEDEDEEEAPPRRKFGKAIVPEYGDLGEMIEGPNGELLLNADAPISDLAKAVTGMGEENTEFFGAVLGEMRATRAELRAEIRDLRKSFDALLEQAEEIAQEEDEAPPPNAPPADLQKSIADSMDEFRALASRMDGMEKAIAERSPHGRLPQDQNGNGQAHISTAQAIEIFRKGLATGELPEDKYHDGCKALVGRGVDPADVLDRFYRKGLRSFIENEG